MKTTQIALAALMILAPALTRPALAGSPTAPCYRWTVGGHVGNPDYGYEEMALSPDGRLLATAAPDGTVKLWDARTAQLVRTISVDASFLYCVAFSPDGTRIAAGGTTYLAGGGAAQIGGSVNVFDTATGDRVAYLPTTLWDITAVTFSPDGTELVDAGYIHNSTTSVDDGKIETFHIASETLVTTMSTAERIGKLIYLPDHKTLLAAGYHYDYTYYTATPILQRWNPETGTLLQSLRTGLAYVNGMSFSADRSAFAVCGRNAAGVGTVELWKSATLQRQSTLTGKLSSINDVVFDAAGKNIVAGGYKSVYDPTYDIYYHRGAVEMWSVTGKRAYTSGILAQSEINSVTFDPSGKSFCAAANDMTVQRYAAANAAVQSVFTQFHRGVNTVAVCDVTDTLAVQDDYGTLALYSATTGKKLAAPPRTTGFVRFVARSANMVFLDAGTRQQIKIVQPNGVIAHAITSQLSSIADVVFSPDGTLAAAAGVSQAIHGVQYKSVEVYRVSDWTRVRQINAFALTPQEVGQGIDIAVAFSQDNNGLAIGVDALDQNGNAVLGNIATYSLQNGKQLATTSLTALHSTDTSMAVIGIAFSHDGKQILVGLTGSNIHAFTVSGAVQIYNTKLARVHQIETEEAITALKLNPSGAELIIGGYLQTPSTGRRVGTLAAIHVASGTVTLRYEDQLGTGVNSLDFREVAGASLYAGRQDATFGAIDTKDLGF